MTSFGRPIIGPRDYLSSGPSSWYETFNRREADAALQRLLGSVPIGLAVEGFLRTHRSGRDAISWTGVVEHLVGLCRVPEAAVEPRVGVAFWAALLIEIDAAKTRVS